MTDRNDIRFMHAQSQIAAMMRDAGPKLEVSAMELAVILHYARIGIAATVAVGCDITGRKGQAGAAWGKVGELVRKDAEQSGGPDRMLLHATAGAQATYDRLDALFEDLDAPWNKPSHEQ